MWTNPHHLAQWLPPEGMQMGIVRGAIKAGESVLMRMHGPGMELHTRAEYREISLNRIVYTQQFCDQDEQISRHPFAPTWPETMLTTITLTPETENRTRVTISSEPHSTTTQAELDVFKKERGGMTKGWTRSFDKLEALLANVEAPA